jgi:hypothetical protein
MAEFNACFVSYRRAADADSRKLVQTFVKALKKRLQWNLPDAQVVFDEDDIEAGQLFDAKLARQLCRSACLVICYGPRHFDASHPYCAKEYLGMRQLEERRRGQLDEYLATNGLIFPVVFRGFASLPAEIAGNRHCIQLDDIVTEEDLKSRKRLKKIDDLAKQIYERWEKLEEVGIAACHDCSEFRFPEAEVTRWLEQHARRPQTPMPGR